MEVLFLIKAVVDKFEEWSVSISITIRLFMAIKYTLWTKPFTSKCLRMRKAIVNELEVLIGNCQTNPHLIMATILDPKFKDTVFSNDKHTANIYESVPMTVRVHFIKRSH